MSSSAALNTDGFATVISVSCAADGYSTYSSGHHQAFVASESP